MRTPGKKELARILSKRGLASRTQAEALIRAGRVRVDGRVILDPFRAFSVETARIEILAAGAGREAGPVGVGPLRENFTLLLHKPKGVVTTHSDEKGRPTVFSGLEGTPGLPREKLIAVGRLDLATTGLLLLTNDTVFSAWVTDPKNSIPRVYLVSVRGLFTDEKAQECLGGIEEGDERLGATRVEIRKSSQRESHLVVELKEGKNREIRRMLKSLGHEVTRLQRVSFGGLQLGALQPGAFRRVSLGELAAAFPGASILSG